MAARHYRLRAGKVGTVRLSPTRIGRKVLASPRLTKAALKVGKHTASVRVRH